MNKTIADCGLRDMANMMERIKASLERHGYDHIHVDEFLRESGFRLLITAVDAFNASNAWVDPDVPDIKVSTSESLSWDDDFDAVERKLHAAIMSQPTRVNRERAHMAWVLSKQLDKLGNYSGEAREAFQAAFRKSMDEAGLTALVDGRAA